MRTSNLLPEECKAEIREMLKERKEWIRTPDIGLAIVSLANEISLLEDILGEGS